MNKENIFTHYPSSYFAEPLRIMKCLGIYSSLNAIVAQFTNCQLEVTILLRSKCNKYIRQYRHTSYLQHTPLDDITVECQCCIFFSAIVVLTSNGEFLVCVAIAFSWRYVL
jgi:hypothetical protein